jgi:hypothetical protein
MPAVEAVPNVGSRAEADGDPAVRPQRGEPGPDATVD